jgi:hypothetical protein
LIHTLLQLQMVNQKPFHWAQSCSSKITQGLPCLV